MLGSVSVSVVCSPSGTPHNSHEISGVTKTSTKIKSVKKKEEILLRRRSLVMWKNSMHPSSPSLRRIKLQLIAADAEGGLCLRRANSHTSTRHDQVHLANFPRLSCMFRPYSFKEPFNRSGIPSTWLVSFIHSDTSTSFAIGTRFNSVIHRLHPDGRSALSIWSTKLQK